MDKEILTVINEKIDFYCKTIINKLSDDDRLDIICYSFERCVKYFKANRKINESIIKTIVANSIFYC